MEAVSHLSSGPYPKEEIPITWTTLSFPTSGGPISVRALLEAIAFFCNTVCVIDDERITLMVPGQVFLWQPTLSYEVTIVHGLKPNTVHVTAAKEHTWPITCILAEFERRHHGWNLEYKRRLARAKNKGTDLVECKLRSYLRKLASPPAVQSTSGSPSTIEAGFAL